VFDFGVPALLAARAGGAGMMHARVDTLFALMAHISDSNVYHRAGPQGAQTVRAHAQRFVDQGGTSNANWHAEALASHRVFVEQRLSPGGAADLLAASCLVHAIAALT
jgi:triphosphoribosyl-dephospho-CoA synthase